MKKEEETRLRILALRELLSSALATLPGVPLVLGFRATDDEEEDCSQISQSLPWLHEAGERAFGTVCGDLREHGIAVLICSTEEVRYRLEVLGQRIRRDWSFPGSRENAS